MSESPAVLEEARAFLRENWRSGIRRRDWLELVVEHRWAALRWPAEWFGRDLNDSDAQSIEALFAEVGAPGIGQDKFNLWAGTVLSYGTEVLKNEFIRPLLVEAVGMCLLYSEPSAGSDLAGLRTTAVRDGDEWVVTGQKVWTSAAGNADYGMLLARTDWDVPKHQGISFFFLPMRQSGVDVRPLRQMTGDARFNEVFLTDARVPDSHRLGAPGEGWRVLQTALAYERAVMGASRPTTARARSNGPSIDAPTGAFGDIPTPDISLLELARTIGKSQDPTTRQRLARLHSMRQVNEWNAQRAQAETKAGGSSPVASLGKLAMAIILHYAGHVQAMLLGMQATLDGNDFPLARDHNYSQMNAYFFSIGGGTDQIQRNIISERLLDLPREPEPDRNLPFKDVRNELLRRQSIEHDRSNRPIVTQLIDRPLTSRADSTG